MSIQSQRYNKLSTYVCFAETSAAQERAFATGAGGDGADGDVGQILATMNANHDILAHLEAAARRIEGDVGAVGMALSQGGQGL